MPRKPRPEDLPEDLPEHQPERPPLRLSAWGALVLATGSDLPEEDDRT